MLIAEVSLTVIDEWSLKVYESKDEWYDQGCWG